MHALDAQAADVPEVQVPVVEEDHLAVLNAGLLVQVLEVRALGAREDLWLLTCVYIKVNLVDIYIIIMWVM